MERNNILQFFNFFLNKCKAKQLKKTLNNDLQIITTKVDLEYERTKDKIKGQKKWSQVAA
jgi:hypothetical protein